MTSIHAINNNIRANEWKYDKNLGVWTNKHGYKMKHTGKIFHEGKEIYFPIARETEDDLKGKALRFEYTGDGSTKTVVSNKWYSYDEQYCHRQKHLTEKRKQKARRRRKQCKENEYQLEKEHALNSENKNNNNNGQNNSQNNKQ